MTTSRNPLKSEAAAFRLLLIVATVAVVLIAVVLVGRAVL